MGYTDCMEKFSADHGYLPPDEQYVSKKHYRNCFIKYMKSYRDVLQYQWFIEDYLISEMEYHAEAYAYSRTFFEEYLNGTSPFLWHHYFELHYWKQAIKKFLRK